MEELLDTIDWQILLEYDKNAFQSYNAISKVVGVHHSTVADRIDSMKDRKVLRPDDIYHDETRGMKRPTSEVIGSYSPASLGLERVHVLFRRIATQEDYNVLHNFCDAHPYTHYLTRLYGSGVTLYAQFDIPDGAFGILQDTLNSLCNNYVDAEEPDMYRDEFEARAIPNYKAARNFEFDQKVNTIEVLWDEFLDQRKDNTLEKPEVKRKIDNIDAELIRELTINGKTKITGLTDHFGLNKSTLSRRVSKIRDHHVRNARLRYGYAADKVMGFNNTQVVTGTFKSNSILKDHLFMKFIHSDDILPFNAFITVDKDRFFLYTKASIGIVGDLMHFLYEHTNPFDLNQYQFYISKTLRYPFYHGNYREDEGFIASEEYIKDNELNRLAN